MTRKRNLETVRRWVEEMWNQGDREVCDELIAPAFVEHAHAPFSATAPGEVDGPRGPCARPWTGSWVSSPT